MSRIVWTWLNSPREAIGQWSRVSVVFRTWITYSGTVLYVWDCIFMILLRIPVVPPYNWGGINRPSSFYDSTRAGPGNLIPIDLCHSDTCGAGQCVAISILFRVCAKNLSIPDVLCISVTIVRSHPSEVFTLLLQACFIFIYPCGSFAFFCFHFMLL